MKMKIPQTQDWIRNWSRKGDVIEYYESDNKEGYSLNPEDISAKKIQSKRYGKCERYSRNCWI